MRSSLSSANTPCPHTHTLTHSHSHFKAAARVSTQTYLHAPNYTSCLFARCLIDPALHASTASLAARLAHHGRERLAVLAQPARQHAQRAGPRAQPRADPQPSACTLGWPRGHRQRAHLFQRRHLASLRADRPVCLSAASRPAAACLRRRYLDLHARIQPASRGFRMRRR